MGFLGLYSEDIQIPYKDDFDESDEWREIEENEKEQHERDFE